MAALFALVLRDQSIAGYYTLSSTSVQLGELPEATVRKLPRLARAGDLLGPP